MTNWTRLQSISKNRHTFNMLEKFLNYSKLETKTKA